MEYNAAEFRRIADEKRLFVFVAVVDRERSPLLQVGEALRVAVTEAERLRTSGYLQSRIIDAKDSAIHNLEAQKDALINELAAVKIELEKHAYLARTIEMQREEASL